MRYWLFIFLLCCSATVFAQGKQASGIVFDKESKERIAIVYIENLTTGKSIYDNLKGEYNIEANVGDIIVFSKQNYFSDTIKMQGFVPQAIYLKRSAIQLNQVNIKGAPLTPEQQLAATKQEYNKVYGGQYNASLLSVSPGSGAGLSIDALWDAISRSGRNAKHLREEIQSDYYQNAIDYRYTRTLVNKVTGLTDGQLTAFMQRYRPGYWFVENASDYEFITYIKNNYRRFLRRPKAYAQQPLVPVNN